MNAERKPRLFPKAWASVFPKILFFVKRHYLSTTMQGIPENE
jgi:hypothetical protein